MRKRVLMPSWFFGEWSEGMMKRKVRKKKKIKRREKREGKRRGVREKKKNIRLSFFTTVLLSRGEIHR